MRLIFKLLGMLISLVTTIFLIVEGVRGGLLIISTIFGIVKLIIILIFCVLLVYIFYLVLTSNTNSTPEQS